MKLRTTPASIERINARLAALGISEFEAAKNAGRGTNFIYDLISGRKKSIKGDGVLSIARVLSCSVEYLLGLSEDVGDPPLHGETVSSAAYAATAAQATAGARNAPFVPRSYEMRMEGPDGRVVPLGRYPSAYDAEAAAGRIRVVVEGQFGPFEPVTANT